MEHTPLLRLFSFFALFVGIYAGLHLLVLRGLRPLFPPSSLITVALGGWMVMMVATPFLIRQLERYDCEVLARICAWLGYGWMGWVFFAGCGFACVAGWNGLTRLFSALSPAPAVPTAAFVLGLSLAAGLYGLWSARQIQVEEVRLTAPQLSGTADEVRIVQISDLHLGLIHRQATAERVLQIVSRLRPDLLVVTGDLVDAQINHLDGLAELFTTVNPPLGKFAVTGNHEYYAGLPQALDFIRRSGFTLLRQQAVAVRPGLVIAGVDDQTAGPRDEAALLSAQRNGNFVVLLKHRPEVDPAARGLFDLQLSGHTHRGQIAPFNLLTALAYPMQAGLYPLEGGSYLYTNRGTGTWGPPMRLCSPPEITLIRLTPTAK